MSLGRNNLRVWRQYCNNRILYSLDGVRSETFMATKVNKIFPGYELCHLVKNDWRFGDNLPTIRHWNYTFHGFPQPSRQILGYYLDYATTASFQILSNSSFVYPTIRRCTISILKASSNNPRKTHAHMKSCIFWDISHYRLLKVNGRFGGTCLNYHGWGVNQARNHHEAGSMQGCASSWFLVWFTLQFWGWRWNVNPKRPLSFN
jgi:hypothetical protein